MAQIQDQKGFIVPAFRHKGTEELSISGTSAQAAAFSSTTKVVRITADVNCYIRYNGTATGSDARLPAGAVEYIGVRPNDRLNVITDGDTGSIWITQEE